MPTVPVLSGPTIERNALPFVPQSASAATSEAFGANRARALGQVGQLLGDVAQRMQDKEDADQLFRAEVSFDADRQAFEREELGRQGVNAKGGSERAAEFWDKAKRKAAEGVTSEKARALFERRSFNVQRATNDTLMRHEQVETNRSLQDSALARVKSAIDLAVGDPSPERVALARQDISGAIDVVSKIRGDTPEITANLKMASLTQLHKQIVMNAVDSDPDAAKAYFYANKKEINGGDAAVIEHALHKGGLLRDAQDAADEIATKFTSEADAMAHVQKTYSGDKEKAIKAELRERFNMRDATVTKAKTEAYAQGQLLVAKGQNVPQSLLLLMDPSQQAALIEHRQARARAAAAEARAANASKPIKTDWSLYVDLREKAAADPEGFKALHLGEYAERIGPSQLEQLLDIQGKTEKSKPKQREAATLHQQMSATISALKITKAQKGEFQSFVQSAVDDAQETKGKPLTYDERQAIIDRAVLQGPDPDRILPWGERRMFQLTPDQRTRFKPNAATDAPATELDALNDALKQQGLPQTPANRLALYNRVTNKP
ncbi:MAG: hypothetical protein V4569_04440 [Pseudomonadota bacterium]